MLYQEVLKELERLEADGRTIDLVLAAMEGEESVERVLSGKTPTGAAPRETDDDDRLPSVYLESVTVCGFRGIGPEATIEIPPGPGLTVVIGRNGSGKSSFAEALEVVLTGENLRWSEKTGPWIKGWKNLHHPSAPTITARFQVEGKRGFTTAAAAWSDGSEFSEVRRTAQHHGEPRTDLQGIGWDVPLDLYRPLLSYNELGVIGAGPAALFDTLTAVLGLETLVGARKTLAEARLSRQRLEKKVTRERLDHLLPTLQDIEDPRAQAAAAGLRKRKRDLDELARLVSDPGSDQGALRRLADLAAPDQERVLQAAGEVERAQSVVADLQGGDAQQAERLARLLREALDHYGRHGDELCPVCKEGNIDRVWREATKVQVERLDGQAARYRRAMRERDQALASARALVASPSIPASEALDTTALRSAWALWERLPPDTALIPDHLLSGHEEVACQAAAVAEQAAARYSEREERWAETLPDLMAWVASARRVEVSKTTVDQVKQAEAALKEVTESLRSARWQPIESQALDLWKDLRMQSNVDLRSVELAGSGTWRRVELTVEVDGTEAPALAVVSQGELSCLALSLFFPRATLADSPFRFLVIDDPVQAMDPARVDGLAKVFSRIACHRQLVVFTHDDRLPESLRRMGIKFTCLKVTRGPQSLVKVAESEGPVEQYFRDAHILLNDDALPNDLAARVIPGICRNGLEAACVQAIRGRRLDGGESHAEVESLLEAAQTLTQKAALALFDDAKRGSKVSGGIRQRWGAGFENAFWAANRGTHRGYGGNLRQLISDCQALAGRLRSQ